MACSAEPAPKFLSKYIPSDYADVGLLLFNTATTGRMDDADYAAYKKEVAAMMKPWGDRALWVEIENVRGEKYSMTYQLRAHRVQEGQLREYVIGTVDPLAVEVSVDADVLSQLDMAPPMPPGWIGR